MDKDYYKILGVGLYAVQAQIKKAYLELRQKFQREHRPGHPHDKKLADIEEAYKVLSDFGSRAMYDMGRTKKHETAKAEKLKETNRVHYETLGVPVGASPEEVKVAYHKLIRACHADKHVNSDEATKAAAKVRYAAVSDAYAVLTGNSGMTGNKRGAPESSNSGGPGYDAKRPKEESSRHSYTEPTPPHFGSQRGEGSASGTGGATGTGSTGFSEGARSTRSAGFAGGTGSTGFAGGAGSTGPAGGARSTGSEGGAGSTGSNNKGSSDDGVFRFTGNKSTFTGQSTGGNADTQKSTPDVHNVFVTLEQIAKGCKKKMHISRELMQPNGVVKTVETIETITVMPGWKAGTKITFSKEIYPGPNKATTDVVFVIQDLPHENFTREGSDICYTAKISLKQALCGVIVDVPTLDGSKKSLDFTNKIIKPNTVEKIEGQGLPFPKDPFKKGDLIVRFDIRFPDSLSKQAMEVIFQFLPD